ncbi:MAG: hypothetical protein JRJ76_07570 [Deltaproteobacteria bacterium]|nr:hypothetical protein [Deltaproteobacteria bacterium]MBW2363579.1 hypothetical protein [Deltaproteobacteria bacterium]
MFSNFPPVYMIPPLLSFIVGITLAVISIVKGRLKTENVLFTLLCIGWTLLSPVFISHHLLTSKAQIITFERFIHFFYVFLPLVHLLFIHKILNIKRNYLIVISSIFSIFLAFVTFTEYYIQGLYEYSWGYIAKGGIAFQFFGIYGFAVLVYMLYCLLANLKRETDSVKRLSNSYMILSFAGMGVLTIFNLPAINGIDLYPAGNFSFIPLSVLAYGILRYRLLDIKSFLHITVVRIISLVIFLLPNWAVFYYARPFFSKIDSVLLFFIFAFWFLVNYLYLTRVQTKLDNKFYRIKFKLKLSEIEFSETIRPMSDNNELVEKIRLTLKETLEFDSVTIFKRIDGGNLLLGPLGYQIAVNTEIEETLFHANHFVDRKTIEANPQYASISEKILRAFSSLKSAYMISLFQNNKLFALLFLSGSSYTRITKDEINFINNLLISASAKLSGLNAFDE